MGMVTSNRSASSALRLSTVRSVNWMAVSVWRSKRLWKMGLDTLPSAKYIHSGLRRGKNEGLWVSAPPYPSATSEVPTQSTGVPCGSSSRATTRFADAGATAVITALATVLEILSVSGPNSNCQAVRGCAVRTTNVFGLPGAGAQWSRRCSRLPSRKFRRTSPSRIPRVLWLMVSVPRAWSSAMVHGPLVCAGAAASVVPMAIRRESLVMVIRGAGLLQSCGRRPRRPVRAPDARAGPGGPAPAPGAGPPFRLRVLGIVDGHVLLGFLNLNREAPVDPRQRPAERRLDAIRLAIIGVVDLGGIAPNGRVGVAHLPQQQAGRLVEVKPHRRLALARADQCIGWAVADLFGMPHAESAEDLLDVRGEVEIGVEPGGFGFRPRHVARRAPGIPEPSALAVEGGDTVARRRMRHGHALIWSFGEDFDGCFMATEGDVALRHASRNFVQRF